MQKTTGSSIPAALAAVAVATGVSWVVLGGESSSDRAAKNAFETHTADVAAENVRALSSTPGDALPPPFVAETVQADASGLSVYDGELPTRLLFTQPEFPQNASARWDNEALEPLSSDQESLLEAWAAIQEAEHAQIAGYESNRADAEQQWLAALRSIALRSGFEPAGRASHAAWTRFQTGWATLVERAAAAGTTVDALTRQGLTRDLARAVGDSGVTLVELRFADPTGDLLVDEEVLRVMFRWRWFTAMAPLTPARRTMPTDELRFAEAWRIVTAGHVEPERRIRWVNEYESVWGDWNGLPCAFARAVIWADAGEAELSEAALEEAARVDPRFAVLREWYRSQ